MVLSQKKVYCVSEKNIFTFFFLTLSKTNCKKQKTKNMAVSSTPPLPRRSSRKKQASGPQSAPAKLRLDLFDIPLPERKPKKKRKNTDYTTTRRKKKRTKKETPALIASDVGERSSYDYDFLETGAPPSSVFSPPPPANNEGGAYQELRNEHRLNCLLRVLDARSLAFEFDSYTSKFQHTMLMLKNRHNATYTIDDLETLTVAYEEIVTNCEMFVFGKRLGGSLIFRILNFYGSVGLTDFKEEDSFRVHISTLIRHLFGTRQKYDQTMATGSEKTQPLVERLNRLLPPSSSHAFTLNARLDEHCENKEEEGDDFLLHRVEKLEMGLIPEVVVDEQQTEEAVATSEQQQQPELTAQAEIAVEVQPEPSAVVVVADYKAKSSWVCFRNRRRIFN